MTAIPYAEVIGDPIDHSKSPLIHRFWLQKLDLAGEYRATRVTRAELPAYFSERRNDPRWRGCNVTAPLKQAAADLVGAPTGLCELIGAVNCVTRTPLSCLIGTNTDLLGIAEALDGVALEGRIVLLIGAGGAARAALCQVLRHGAEQVVVAARDKSKAERLVAAMGRAGSFHVEASALDAADDKIQGAALVVNATPMGMKGAPPMHPVVIENLVSGQAVFDMVYAPAETELLRTARQKGAIALDGLKMLIGQAAPAFELFFGSLPPRRYDSELRDLLTS